MPSHVMIVYNLTLVTRLDVIVVINIKTFSIYKLCGNYLQWLNLD
ncbi:hypothetical protein MtrunA17_Chr2g0332011 [Medicago truncatula]|uniref:Uncharacterized protein n=1 Tax=Medicago truncatula TaxID=3880 RepID=I3SI09_MEDTR|nr:unknown [Medicago truncatula]RHN76429.1 hypothetical protein MtrunA17_Chr2g0332011 [Medicago truncatula]